MKIAVVGAGAMGCLFGGLLCKAGNDVWLVDVWEKHVNAINNFGLKMSKQDEEITVFPKATANPLEVNKADLVIIFVKGFHTDVAMKSVQALLNNDTIILSLQNGIGNVEIIKKYIPEEQILYGMTTLTSDLQGPGHIDMTYFGKGDTSIKPAGNTWEDANRFSKVFNEAGLKTYVKEDVEYSIWKKLVINCNFNVLCALTKLTVGNLLDSSYSKELLIATTKEISAVANSCGINLSFNNAWDHLMTIGNEARAHAPSMLIDLLNHRKTEIDFLNGAVVSEGKKRGVNTPINEAFVNIIKTVENTYHIQHTCKA